MQVGLLLLVLVVLVTGCRMSPGTPVARHFDEIVVAGERFRTGTPVVLWTDPGGYDAYRVDKRFGSFDHREPEHWPAPKGDAQRYGLRDHNLTEEQLHAVRGGGWTLEQLQQVVDQFVIHYDACGTSRRCFEVLHDHRHLSAHFLLDLDGTIYQTLDVKERAWHAAHANSRSVGIEIAHIGAYARDEANPFDRWYATDADGRTRITIPDATERQSIRTPGFVGRPSRDAVVVGNLQGRDLEQYDFTDEQYDALIKLTAALHRVLPKIELDAPRGADGGVVPHLLTPDAQDQHQGLIGHYHLSEVKVDPGPAFDWGRVIQGARDLVP
ncbi:N-acetylmuramoyl-L-alanine amidase [Algisphaera agarilytica]|uniref:N-acetylmuramoyl-L-alanine amidase n=1 Tax=Algisphaera agarilytica TaxID=1385975 RepID=A0A7X0LK40_9BACT|nr:peptidoglycan recognition family protein [Algisphaera agarilytica]MBB6429241.1 N-acetyl-anhydromuramyl-L-alanine amidase AmpD [Algisphaera agarilytica]